MQFLNLLCEKHPELLNPRRSVCLQIENEPYMKLTIESIGKMGSGNPCLSICHYGYQNGDAMRDPEMLFEVVSSSEGLTFVPYYWRNDYIGVENDGSRYPTEMLQKFFGSFAATWDKNLRSQGFVRLLEEGKVAIDA